MLIVKSRWWVCECVLYGPFDFSTYFDICHNKMLGDKFILHLCYRSNRGGLGSCFISSLSRTQGDGSSWKWLVVMAKGKRSASVAQTARYFGLDATFVTAAHNSLARDALTGPCPRPWMWVLSRCRKGRAGNTGWATLVITLTEINYLKEQLTSVPSSLIIQTRKGRAT